MGLGDTIIDVGTAGIDLCTGANTSGIRTNIAEKNVAKTQKKAVETLAKNIPALKDEISATLESQTYRNIITTNTESYRNIRQGLAAEGLKDSVQNIDRNFAATCDGVKNSIQYMAQSHQTIAESAQGTNHAVNAVVKEVNGVKIMGNSLLDRVDYYGRFMQTATLGLLIQVHRIAGSLERMAVSQESMAKSLSNQNSLQAQGAAGEYGFAKTVHRHISQRIAETEHQGGRNHHRFFVYHPDSNWHAAFFELISQNALPETFCAKSNDLDKICQIMLSYRQVLSDETEDGKDIVFHLLIPAWSNFVITDPLHFPDELQPMHVEGTTNEGKPYFTFNLPAAPRTLLHDISNAVDPKGYNTKAVDAGSATFLLGGGSVNGLCFAAGVGLASVTGLGFFVIIPVWFGGNLVARPTILNPMVKAVENAIREDAPRILGSHRRLER